MDSPLKNMSQKESEWENELREMIDGIAAYQHNVGDRAVLLVKKVLSTREKEIAEEVEKKELLISHLYNFHYCNCEDSRIYGKE